MTPERTSELIARFHHLRILVVGDLMLDEFVWGNVSRISPEAPVPIVHVERESYFPGGAANVARNLREFSSSIHVMGQIGDDPHGARVRALLARGGIHLDAVQSGPEYRTIVKTRIIARHQQVVRVDRERPSPLTPDHAARAIEQFAAMLPNLDAVIFEDYAKGLLQQTFADALLTLACSAGKIVTVDPNPRNPIAWRGITCATPNRMEAFAMAGVPWSDPSTAPLDDAPLLEVGARLLDRWSAQTVLVTLGEHGMMLFRPTIAPFHIPTVARDVFDVSGAGDTAIALLTLALAAGASPEEAAELSNRASGIVVGKVGTATVTPGELLDTP